MSGLEVAGVAILSFIMGVCFAIAVEVYSDLKDLRRWEDDSE